MDKRKKKATQIKKGISVWGKLTDTMATGEIVGSTFFAAVELLKVEDLAVGSGPHLINDAGHMLSDASLVEEPIKGIVSSVVSLNEEPAEATRELASLR